MTYAREKRLLLGLVALGVALPLPLNQALDWPALALFLLAVVLFLRRAVGGSERWLGARALNLLGLAYLPLLVLDLMVSGRVQPVRPILHLTLFGIAAKLWSLARERDKWQAWIGIFFVFLAAMATSTHPAVVVYLLAFLALTVLLLARFVHLHVLSAHAGGRERPPALGVAARVAGVVLATAAIAAPLFALLPRVRSPFVVGPGVGGAEPPGARMGFGEDMSLDLIGRLRASREVALRLELEGQYPPPPTARLKATAYEAWAGRVWRPVTDSQVLRREPTSAGFRLAVGRPVGRARVELEPLRSTALVLPLETLAVEIDALRLTISSGGAVSLPGMPGRRVQYTAQLGEQAVATAPPPGDEAGAGALALDGVTPRMTALADSWAGAGSATERARRIEERLQHDYAYTTEYVGRTGASPVEDFLFQSRRGHCEYFASAMVLLLRAEEIPARLVTGFYGAEWSSWEEKWIVRQSNAHAWVEAWLPGRGWTVFDPTPPNGRPTPAAAGLLSSLSQAWEAAVSAWDRWVISYDFDDQVGVLGSLRAWWSELMRSLRGAAERGAPPPPPPGPSPAAESAAAAAQRAGIWRWALVVTLLAAAAALALMLRGRPAWTSARAYRTLRATLATAGLPVDDAVAPFALARLVERRLPAAAAPVGRLVRSYVAETFALEPPTMASALLRADLDAVDAALRRRRRERRAGRTSAAVS